ncbi:hypothetical protein PSCICP_30180 [Pseudomonas cichorii]|uniref:Secreted protein n=1 Tax=Pseudomonas cichorii TaxID=36746 RepID=A0ABQ1DPX7_PSECI|nr:hypothetical protein PSCICP_30180 [Pseudomonas cichorii]
MLALASGGKTRLLLLWFHIYALLATRPLYSLDTTCAAKATEAVGQSRAPDNLASLLTVLKSFQ